MTTITLQLDEWADEILDALLKEQYKGLVDDYNRRKNGGNRFGVFHNNKHRDIKALKKRIKAFRLVLEYNGIDYKELT